MDPTSPELNSAPKDGSNNTFRQVAARMASIVFGPTKEQYLQQALERQRIFLELVLGEANFLAAVNVTENLGAEAPTIVVNEIGSEVIDDSGLKKPSKDITILTSETVPESGDQIFYRLEANDGTEKVIGSYVAGVVADIEEPPQDKKSSKPLTPTLEGSNDQKVDSTQITTTAQTIPTGLAKTAVPIEGFDDQSPDLTSAVLTALASPYFNDPLKAESNYQDTTRAYLHRLDRYRFISNGNVPTPKMDGPESGILYENIIENNRELAPDGWLHRNLAIPLALRYRNPLERERLMRDFDDAARRDTRDVIDRVKSGKTLDYDIFIRGAGEYAAVAAQHIRELAPELKIFVADQNDHTGGQFADHGPRPALRMNSRVRVGGRYEPYVPRTEGDINSQGPFAILSLSDLQDDTYATNNVRGDMTKMAVTIAADDVAICTRAGDQIKRRDGRFDVPLQTRFEGEELEYNVRASVVIDARGIRQESALINVLGLDAAIADGRYYTTAELYHLFGGKYTAPGAAHDPMAAFDGKIVELDGFGDSAQTAAELLIRALPIETYGPRRREGPKGIRWVNAPGLTRDEIVAFLRSRYSGSFPQFLPKSNGDPGGLLLPFIGKAVSQTYRNGTWRTLLTDGSNLSADVKIDTTNKAGKLEPDDMPGVLSLGPAFTRYIPSEPKELLDALRVGENTDALWLGVPAALIDSEEGIRIARTFRKR